MGGQAQPAKGEGPGRERLAESVLAEAFEMAGWEVRREAARGPLRPDLLVRRRGIAYAVELKVGSEGRSDRLVPLLARAVLQAARAAGGGVAPLAVVAARRIPRRVAEQVIKFAEDYASDTAVGVIDFEGLRLFRGPHLEAMNAEAKARLRTAAHVVGGSGHPFSDLNQWMLKVLLAPELPERLLSAPRARYRNTSELARAANVSVMSAFRFVQQLQHEGYLHESAGYLSLVRREDLFGRWRSLSARSARELQMRLVLPGDPQVQLRKALGDVKACLALFAAADALGLGFVRGVPPYVYVERLQPPSLPAWKNLRPCELGESPDVIVRQAPAPQSVFRGAVCSEGAAACDVLQVWVDVAAHPSRGREQADLIRKRVLRQVIEGGP
jgi:hypothetical protein